MKQRVTFGFIVWAISTTLLCAVSATLVERTYAKHSKAQRWADASRLDPKLGIDINVPQPVHGTLSDKPILLVLVGECGSCSANTFEPAKLRIESEYQPVIVVSAADDAIPENYKVGSHAVIADPVRQLEQQLNVTWRPRFAVVQGSRLVWLQPNPATFPQGVRYVQ